MRLPKKLIVTHAVDRAGKNIVQIESKIWKGMVVCPDEIRALAAALCKAADDADQRRKTARKRCGTAEIYGAGLS